MGPTECDFFHKTAALLKLRTFQDSAKLEDTQRHYINVDDAC